MLGTFFDTQKSLQTVFQGLAEDNFDYAPPYSRVNCPEGFTRNRTLEPHKKCNDEFWFETHANNITLLNSYQLDGPQGNYCIEFHQGCNNHIICVDVKLFLL